MRVLVVIGTRPEAIKLFPVVHALQADAAFDVSVCDTGQHGELTAPVLEFAQVVVDHRLVLHRGERTSLAELTANLLTRLDEVMAKSRPDRVIVQGDTQSALAGAMAAYCRRISVAHVEAGLRSGDLHNPWPEEGNRRMIAQIAQQHFAPTKAAADDLLSLGIALETVVMTGNTVVDALEWTRSQLECGGLDVADAKELVREAGARKIVLVTAHRRESWGQGLADIVKAVALLAQRDDAFFIWPMHANPALRDRIVETLGKAPNVVLAEPLSYPDFVHLLSKACLALTDSGGVQEEAPSFGVPVLVMRDTTERKEGMALGTARLVGTRLEDIVHHANALLNDAALREAMRAPANPYGDGRAARRITAALLKR